MQWKFEDLSEVHFCESASITRGLTGLQCEAFARILREARRNQPWLDWRV